MGATADTPESAGTPGAGGSTGSSHEGGAPSDPSIVSERPVDGVIVVRLNRPERLNALDRAMVDNVAAAMREAGADRNCRAVVLTGSGRGFCAGMDVRGAVEHDASGPSSPVTRLRNQERYAEMVRAIRELRVPVIAAVNGPAAGAGFGLALACDVRVAAEEATFHVAAVKIGLSAGECGISYHLPRHVGTARALEIMLTGRPFDAAEADRIGLVTRVVPGEMLMEAALDVAGAIAANSEFAVWMTKQVTWKNLDLDFDAAIELENRTQTLATMTSDFAEATRAFVEKRTPRFTGA